MEVIDLRSIVPLDEELIYRSVRKTNRVVIAHEDSLLMGFGAEIAARIAANCIERSMRPLFVSQRRTVYLGAESRIDGASQRE